MSMEQCEMDSKVTISVRFLAVVFIIASIAAVVGYAALLSQMKSELNKHSVQLAEMAKEITHLKEFQAEVTKRVEAEFGAKINTVEKVQAVETKRIEEKSDLGDKHVREINTLQNNSTRELMDEKSKNVELYTALQARYVQAESNFHSKRNAVNNFKIYKNLIKNNN